MAPRKEAAKPSHAQAALEKRKLRNRLSQKAFRAKQNLRIKELESRVANGPVCETQRVAELEERNKVLFAQLLSCHRKLENVQITLQSFTESTAALLGMSGRSNSPGVEDSTRTTVNHDQNCNQQAEGHNTHLSNMASTTDSESSIRAEEHSFDLAHHDDMFHVLDMSTASATIDTPDLHTSTDSTVINDSLAVSALCNVIENPYSKDDVPTDQEECATDIISSAQVAMEYPHAFYHAILYADDGSYRSSSHSYSEHDTDHHMSPCLTPVFSFSGTQPSSYEFAVARSPLLVKGAHSEVRRTNSAFSDHFNVVEHFLQESWKRSDAILTNLDDWYVHLTSMSTFVLTGQIACGKQFLSC
jgi:hypothetical protein